MADFKETAVSYLDADGRATFHSSERKWINKILKLRESYPDDVQIEYMPEDNHGMLLAHIPKSWLRVSPPKKSNYTDEQRAAIAERLQASRNKQEC